MVVLTMTNAQLGISCFERNGVFTSSHTSFSSPRWRPIFGVALNTKNSNKKIPILGSTTTTTTTARATLNCENISALLKKESSGGGGGGGGGGGVLEKELQFKPSFDEYLKAMESVKTGKEKKQAHHKSNRHEWKNDDLRDEGALKRNNKFEGNLDQEKKTPKNGRFGYKERRIRESNGKESSAVRGKPRGGETTDGSNAGKKTRDGNAQVRTAVSYSVKNSRSSINEKGTEFLERKMEAFDRREVGFRRNEMGRRLVRNYVEVVEELGDRKLSRSGKAFLETGEDDNAVEVERAAFKTFPDVLDKPRASQREMEERIQKLAMRLNGADIDMPEWMFSKMIRSAKIKYTDHSILRVIQILGKLGNWRRVLQVIEWLQRCERFKSHNLRYIYTTALDVLGKARRPMEALNVFHAMQQQMSSYPDLVAYHCIAVTLGQAGHMKELFDVIDSMRSPPKKKFKTGALGKWEPCLEPDIVVYNAILNACVQQKQWEGAFWVLQQLKQQGQQPSTTTYGLVMEVMLACGKYNLVHEFFRKIQKSSIPNALAYKVLVNTLWREGKTDEAVLAVQDMERRGIVGSAALYYDLARCLCSAGRCQEALMQIEKICKVANKPLVVTYTGLIQACLDSGNIQNGVYIFNRMKDFCSPNLITCNIMLKAYLEHGLSEEAKELFQKMLDGKHISNKSDYNDRVIPDIFTFNTMLDACIEEKRWSDLEYVYERMLHRGYHFNPKRHLRMILDASRAGKGELLETTWKHLAQADRIPPLPLIKERFCVKLGKGDHVAAISCITSQPVSELQAFSKGAWLNLFKENAQRFRMDSLVQLIHEVSNLIARSDSPKPVLQNLITSCKEFLRTHMTVAGIN